MQDSNKSDSRPGMKSQTQDAFKWWNELSTFQAGDTFGTKIKRVFIRIGGIIFLVAFSPFLLFALLVAFIVML